MTNPLDAPKRWFYARVNEIDDTQIEHYLEQGMEPFAVTDNRYRFMWLRIYSSIRPTPYDDDI